MATFKVGQRVKRARHCTHGVPLGSTGVITGFKDSVFALFANEPEAFIAWDDAALRASWPPPWSFAQETLEPLIDSGSADEWAERKVRELLRDVQNPLPLDIDILETIKGQG